jgi:peptide deformylase
MKVVLYPQEVLRQTAKSVEVFDEDLKNLAQTMQSTMYDYRGIGLAANQVGDLRRVFILDVEWRDPSQDEGPVQKNPEVYINPEIISYSGETEYEEGCLSIPGVCGVVKRHELIEVAYQDLSGKSIQERLEGLKAIAFQHELDHLNGVLFFDHLSAFKRRTLLEKYTKLQLEKASEK